jgi:hypothetical protein
MSANQQKRAHYHQVAKAKKLVGDEVCALARGQRIPLLNKGEVEVCWYVTDRRVRDADSLYPFLKAAQDGLVDAGVFLDDHAEYIPHAGCWIKRGDKQFIEVIITEIE